MAGGRKRAAEDEASGPSTRSAKVAKTDTKKAPAKGGRKRGPKTTMAASQFTAQALPLHVNITHTPPVLDSSAEGKEGATSVVHADPGFVGTTTLVPSVFSTGSYGWKGNKRLTIELPNPNGGDEKEKVHVMLTINATVMGSKDVVAEEVDDAKEVEAVVEEESKEGAAEETNGAEAAEPENAE